MPGWPIGPATTAETRVDAQAIRVLPQRAPLSWRNVMRLKSRGIALGSLFALASVAPIVAGQGSAVDEIAKYRAALQDGNPAELWEAARRRSLEAEARPEERLARAMRPRPRPWRRQGRIRAAAALLRRRRPRDGPGDAARLVHGRRCRAIPRRTPGRGPSAARITSRTSRRWSRTSRPSRAASR